MRHSRLFILSFCSALLTYPAFAAGTAAVTNGTGTAHIAPEGSGPAHISDDTTPQMQPVGATPLAPVGAAPPLTTGGVGATGAVSTGGVGSMGVGVGAAGAGAGTGTAAPGAMVTPQTINGTTINSTSPDGGVGATVNGVPVGSSNPTTTGTMAGSNYGTSGSGGVPGVPAGINGASGGAQLNGNVSETGGHR